MEALYLAATLGPFGLWAATAALMAVTPMGRQLRADRRAVRELNAARR